MYTIAHNGTEQLQVTLQATGQSINCTPQTIEKAKAALYSHTLYNYLHHRWCVYTKVNRPETAHNILRAMHAISRHRYDMDALQQTVRSNQAFFQFIAPKKSNKWTSIIQQITA